MKLKVMIVEDESLAVFLLKMCLEKFGCEVIASVSTGELAIETAKAIKPDFITMDIMLAGKIDGIEAASAIKSVDPGMNIIYISAYSDPEIIKKAQAVGSVAYIQKPFDYEFLHLAVNLVADRVMKKSFALSQCTEVSFL